MITQEELKKILHYDPETGMFTRISKTTNSVNIGDKAGYVGKNGYVYISIKNKAFLAHRLAWLYATGKMPEAQIDHINHERSDNRLLNLRCATNCINHRNQTMKSTNTSGFVGVTWNKNARKWLVQIKVDYKNIYLGIFQSLDDAISARKAANIKYGFHENHGLHP